MIVSIVLIVTLIAFGEAGYIGHAQLGGHGGVSSQSVVLHHDGVDLESNDHHEKSAYPKYQFRYSVSDDHTSDNKMHWETRDGGHVEGEYSLLQPDGSTRVVTYTADDHKGFNAVVSHGGSSHY